MKQKAESKKYAREDPLLAQTRGLMRRFGLRAKKGLGQHFLIDKEILDLIISTAALTPADVALEIGPGLGILTAELARHAGYVLAVELDTTLAGILKKTLASLHNIAIINEDILDIEPAALLEGSKVNFPPSITDPRGYKVVANLPYYITSPVLRHFLETTLKPQMMLVMVQKEVAEAIVAKPGDMSVLSISVQFYGKPEIISPVPALCFYPEPEVDSALLRIMVYSQPPVVVADVDSFFRLVSAGFYAPRKQLGNSLTRGLGFPRNRVLSLLETGGIDSRRRAETLTLEEWAHLLSAFAAAISTNR
jgi:16S rRNA (adenine1518-N6/adenine1519-N6)-dimethyltransferase